MTYDKSRESWKPAFGCPRPLDRIPIILEALRKAWEANPDMRFGQLVANISSGCTGPSLGNIFYMEDTVFMAELEHWMKDR